MKYAVLGTMLGAFLLQPTLAMAATSRASEVADAEHQINDALHDLSEGFRLRDPALASSLYIHNDSYMLFDVYPPLYDRGYARVLAKNIDYLKAIDGASTVFWTDKHIEVDHKLAFFRGLMHVDAKVKTGGRFGGVFRHTLIFRKFGTKWLVIHEHVSVPAKALDMQPVADKLGAKH